MYVSTIILIVISALWLFLEAGLIIRDRKRGRGTTTIDNKTRYYNFISLTASPIVAAILTGIPWIRSLGINNTYIFGLGCGIMLFGLALRLWSVIVLGTYFRTTIELDDNQKVIQSGPYRLIRHPSCTGLILTCIGYGIALQNVVSFLAAIVFPTLALIHRIRIEEMALAAGMGAEYVSYQSHTKKLIPGIW